MKCWCTQIFDTASFTWRRGPSLPQAVWGQCAAALEPSEGAKGRVITSGGYSERAVRSSMRHTFALPEGGEWQRMPDLWQGRATHGCAHAFYKVWIERETA